LASLSDMVDKDPQASDGIRRQVSGKNPLSGSLVKYLEDKKKSGGDK